MRVHVLPLLLLALLLLSPAHGRINATGALETFWISDCNLCTNGQKDSIFCTAAGSDSDWVQNATTRYTVAMKKSAPPQGLGPGDGAKYCWTGTFGSMLNAQGGPFDILGSANVSARLSCEPNNLFYRQCYIPVQLAIILISIGAVVLVGGCTCMCFCCGCCRCLNNKDDPSKWGVCNRYCPWMPCSDPPVRGPELSAELLNPLTQEAHKKSLFGKTTEIKKAEEGAAGASGTDSAADSAATGADKPTLGVPYFGEGASASSSAAKGSSNPFAFKRPGAMSATRGKSSLLSSKAPVFESQAEEGGFTSLPGLAMVLKEQKADIAELAPPPPPPSAPPPPLPTEEQLQAAEAAAAATAASAVAEAEAAAAGGSTQSAPLAAAPAAAATAATTAAAAIATTATVAIAAATAVPVGDGSAGASAPSAVSTVTAAPSDAAAPAPLTGAQELQPQQQVTAVTAAAAESSSPVAAPLAAESSAAAAAVAPSIASPVSLSAPPTASSADSAAAAASAAPVEATSVATAAPEAAAAAPAGEALVGAGAGAPLPGAVGGSPAVLLSGTIDLDAGP